MDPPGLYPRWERASRALNQQAVTASNLANASTPGFRAQLKRLARSAGGRAFTARTHAGNSVNTGYDADATRQDGLHLAPAGRCVAAGWLAGRLQTADGSEGEALRNGSIQVDPTGQLTIQGHPVVGEAGPIAVPEGAEITIAADGTIGAESGAIRQIQLRQWGVWLVKPRAAKVQRGDDGIFV